MSSTTKASPRDDLDEKLRDLWSRRATLSVAEWEALYSIIHHVLKPKYHDLLSSLAMTPDEAIQDFFADKVFALTDNATQAYHVGVLGVFYMRYLISLQRDPYVGRRALLQQDAEDADAALDRLLRNQAAPPDFSNDDLPLPYLYDLVEMELAAPLPNRHPGKIPSQASDAIAQRLGVGLEDIIREARDFLSGQGHWAALAEESQWIRLYLRCHQCPEQEDAIPVSTLARRHHIPSYHERAVKIGVTVPKSQDAALDAFRSSYRGQWLARLGIPVDPEHLENMSLALKILCLVALSHQEPC